MVTDPNMNRLTHITHTLYPYQLTPSLQPRIHDLLVEGFVTPNTPYTYGTPMDIYDLHTVSLRS